MNELLQKVLTDKTVRSSQALKAEAALQASIDTGWNDTADGS